ncbi:SRPBCC family protein [Knoellia sp. CPCC 206450]|uniref:SRPBCC family protein n=1 Tax=Knoellia tibetensis TaxID=3404798 RepID=UPI003B42C2C9
MTTKVEKSVTVDVPVEMAYNQWTQFEEFPKFMGGVQEVQQLDDKRLHWVAEIAGVRREWDATILEQRQDEKIAWAATQGATNAGAVYFSPVGAGQTQVRLELEYEPEGLIEKAGDAVNVIERQAEKDVESFKTFIEGRMSETGAWRGDVEGTTVGTPGVESATSQGDSGKAGLSGTAKVAGAAGIAAAGVAAAAATRTSGSGGSSDETEDAGATTEGSIEATQPPVTETTTAPETTLDPDTRVDDAIILDEPPRTGGAGGTGTGV